jgi:hypothetical protein
LEKALVGVREYKGSLVNECADAVRRLGMDTTLSDDDISERMLKDEGLKRRASELGVKLLKLTVSSWKLIEPAELLNGPYGPLTLTAIAITPAA